MKRRTLIAFALIAASYLSAAGALTAPSWASASATRLPSCLVMTAGACRDISPFLAGVMANPYRGPAAGLDRCSSWPSTASVCQQRMPFDRRGATAVVPASRARSGTMTDLGTFGGPTSMASGINDLGQVTGTADTADGSFHAFRWSPSGGTSGRMKDLGTFSDGSGSSGMAINDFGQIAGIADTAGVIHVVRWSPSGGMQDLGTLGGPLSLGYAINDLGQITGLADTADGSEHAFRWTPSSRPHMQDLGTLGGEGSVSLLNSINDLGEVTGGANTADGSEHAFLWTPSSRHMQDLGTLGGGTYSEGREINDLGEVTGVAHTADGSEHAFRWTASGGMQDLGTLGGTSTEPSAINDWGQIVGHADTADGVHAFRWTP